MFPSGWFHPWILKGLLPASLLLLASPHLACSDDAETSTGASTTSATGPNPDPDPLPEACETAVETPDGAALARLDGAHATDDPTTDRLCEEGATPPEELDNPWDLHCDLASGRGAAVDELAAPPTRLRILEWNIKFGTDLDGVIDVLENHPIASQADVLLLVEVDRGCDRSGQVDEARTLGERWGMDWVFGVEFVEHDQGGCEEGNAILSRHALGNAVHRFHDVGHLERGGLFAPYDWALDPEEKRTGRRSFVGADLRFGDTIMHVVSSHLENLSTPEERGAQIGEIVDLVDGLPRRAACIAGDLNVYPDVGETVLDAPLFDRMAAACFDNPHGDMPQNERRTRPGLGYQIDFTFLRQVEVVDRGVLNDLPDVPSDHYPVWVDVEAL